LGNLNFNNLVTPSLLVHEDLLEQNIRRMQDLSEQTRVRLRPMVKTHKSPYIALKQLQAGASGIMTATPGEAAVFADYGIDDITLAYPVFHFRAREMRLLARKLSRLTITVDNMDAINALVAVAGPDDPLHILIKINSGLNRLGVEPDDKKKLLDLAEKIAASGSLKLEGVATHGGQVYQCSGPEQVEEVAQQEIEAVLAAKNIIEKKFTLSTVAVGSTPTVKYMPEDSGITEIRPGNYVYHDRIQVALGVADINLCALRVVSTVLSRPAKNRAVIDAGSKSLGLDQGAHGSGLVKGFGFLPGNRECTLVSLSEELGVLQVPGNKGLRPGDRVEIIPNHACSVANLFREAFLVKDKQVTGKIYPEAR